MQLLIGLLCIILVGLAGCRAPAASSSNANISIKDSIVYHIKDSIRITERFEIKDSVVLKDSIVQTIDENGNILKSEYYRLKESYKNTETAKEELQAKYDKLLAEYNKKDSTNVVTPVYVEKELSWWQRFKIGVGGGAIALVLGGIIYFVFKIKA